MDKKIEILSEEMKQIYIKFKEEVKNNDYEFKINLGKKVTYG